VKQLQMVTTVQQQEIFEDVAQLLTCTQLRSELSLVIDPEMQHFYQTFL